MIWLIIYAVIDTILLIIALGGNNELATENVDLRVQLHRERLEHVATQAALDRRNAHLGGDQ